MRVRNGRTPQQAYYAYQKYHLVSPAELLPKKAVSLLQRLSQATGPPSAFYMSRLDDELHHGKCERAVTVMKPGISGEFRGYCWRCHVTLFIPRDALSRIEWR